MDNQNSSRIKKLLADYLNQYRSCFLFPSESDYEIDIIKFSHSVTILGDFPFDYQLNDRKIYLDIIINLQ